MEGYQQQIREVWNRHAANYDEKHNQFEDREAWRQILVEHIGSDKKKRVLDIGTGTGFLASLAAEAGYQSFGIDLAEQMIDQAKQTANDQVVEIAYLTGDWNQLPFENKHFDVIINRCIMWTILEPEKTLIEWIRVLKPGGRILCFCPENVNHEQPDHYDKSIEERLPLRNANAGQLAEVLKQNGYHNTAIIELNELMPVKLFQRWLLIVGEK